MVPLVAVAPSEDGEVVGVLLFITYLMQCCCVCVALGAGTSGVVDLNYAKCCS